MSGLYFFGTEFDHLELAAEIFAEQSVIFIPGYRRDKNIIKLENPADLAEHWQNYDEQNLPALDYYIVSPEWQIEPLCSGYTDNNPNMEPFYAIAERYGGPSIRYIPGNLIQDKRGVFLTIGSVSDFPYYISESFFHNPVEGNYRTFDRSEEFKKGFNTIKKLVMKRSKPAKSEHGSRRARILAEAFAKYKNRELKLGAEIMRFIH